MIDATGRRGMVRRWGGVWLVGVAVLVFSLGVGVVSASAAAFVSPLLGSPFSTGAGSRPFSVAFSPGGGLLATSNYLTDGVSLFSVSGSGLTALAGSPFSTGAGSGPVSVAVSPGGGLLATANSGTDGVSLFSVSASGLTKLAGSPFSTGAGSRPRSVAFSPGGGLLATANYATDGVSLFSVSGSGLTKLAGSPFSTGAASAPISVAFSPGGGLLATANSGTGSVSLFSVSGSGLTKLAGSPFSTGAASGPISVAFSPGGGRLATANYLADSVSLFSLSGPGASILSPASGATFAQGQVVPASYSCQDATGGPGIVSCAGTVPSGGAIDTSTPGARTFTVTASSFSGLTATATSRYVVIPSTIPPPVLSGVSQSHSKWRRGHKLARVAKHKPPVGTTFSFTLNEIAKVALAFTQQHTGRKVKGKCVAATKKNHHRPGCKLTLTKGKLSFTAHPGKNTIFFQGRVTPSNTLKPGMYTLIITATNSNHQHSRSKRLTFTIVK
ncbi:MAG: lactonase family protein [Solirubrobacteraceae bacterium]